MIDIHGNYYPPFEYYRSWKNYGTGFDSDAIFSELYYKFNTITIPLQTMQAFYYDVDNVARESSSPKAFRAAMLERKNRRLAELRKIFFALKGEYFAFDPEHFNLPPECESTSWEAFHEMSCDAILRFLVSIIPGTPKTFTPATKDNPKDDLNYQSPCSSPEVDVEASQAWMKEAMQDTEGGDFVDSPPGIRCEEGPGTEGADDVNIPKRLDYADPSTDNRPPNMDSVSQAEACIATNMSSEVLPPAKAGAAARESEAVSEIPIKVNEEGLSSATQGLISPPRPPLNANNNNQPQSQNDVSPDSQAAVLAQSLRNVESFCKNTPSSGSFEEEMDHTSTDDDLSSINDDFSDLENEDATVSFEDVPHAAPVFTETEALAVPTATTSSDSTAPIETTLPGAATEEAPISTTAISSLSHGAYAFAASHTTLPAANTITSLEATAYPITPSSNTVSTATEIGECATAIDMAVSEQVAPPSAENDDDYFYDDVDMDDTSLLLDDASLDAINAGLQRKRKTRSRMKAAEKRRGSPSASHAPGKVTKKAQRANTKNRTA